MMDQSRRIGPWQWAALAIIVVIAALLRLDQIDRISLSVDELGSMETAAGRGQIHLVLPRGILLTPPPIVTSLNGAPPIWKVPLTMGADVHPPLYFVLLRLWQDVFGGGDASSRALSAFAGVVGVILIFDLGRWLGDVSTGLWAGLLMALAEPQIIYSQDARPYALVIAFALAAADALLRIERLGPNRRRLAALVASLIAACLTHYFVIAAVAAMGLYAVVTMRGRARSQVIASFALAGATVLILWGHGMWQQLPNFSDPWMYWFRDDVPDHSFATFRRAALLPARYLVDLPTGFAAYGGAVLYFLPWLLCRRSPSLLLPISWLILCVGLVTALDLYRGTNQLLWIKYTLLAGPAVCLILPLLLRGGRMRHVLPALATVACLTALPQTHVNDSGGFKALAARLDRMAKPNEPILFAGAGWGDWYGGGLYMGIERYITKLPDSVAILNSPATWQLQSELADRTCWMVMSWTSQSPTDLLPGFNARKIDVYPGLAMLYEMTPRAKD